MNDCTTCVVRNRAICSALQPGERALLGQLGRARKILRGQSLVWEGEEELFVANVTSGILQISMSLADGREQIVGVVFPSDFIGRPFGERSPYRITALNDAELCVFPRAAFGAFAKDHPELEHTLLRRTLEELDRAREWMVLLAKKSAREKIATLLIEMSVRLLDQNCQAQNCQAQNCQAQNCQAEPGALNHFDLPLDRQQIGNLLGLTIETVSRQLMKLKGEGLIDLPDRKRVIIHDRPRLSALAMAA
jgi:CRP/FNR family transcriptional regulator, anaerobic regulatory protein